MVRLMLAASVALGFCGGAATAAEPQSSARVVGSFTACRVIAAAAERLACYDRATAALEKSVAAKEVRIVDDQDLRKARRSLFGFTLPRIALFGGGDEDGAAPDQEFSEIRTTVAGAHGIANGRVELTLAGEDGAVWRTTEPVAFPPRAGAAIHIRKATLGNYFITFDRRTYRGMRVR